MPAARVNRDIHAAIGRLEDKGTAGLRLVEELGKDAG